MHSNRRRGHTGARRRAAGGRGRRTCWGISAETVLLHVVGLRTPLHLHFFVFLVLGKRVEFGKVADCDFVGADEAGSERAGLEVAFAFDAERTSEQKRISTLSAGCERSTASRTVRRLTLRRSCQPVHPTRPRPTHSDPSRQTLSARQTSPCHVSAVRARARPRSVRPGRGWWEAGALGWKGRETRRGRSGLVGCASCRRGWCLCEFKTVRQRVSPEWVNLDPTLARKATGTHLSARRTPLLSAQTCRPASRLQADWRTTQPAGRTSRPASDGRASSARRCDGNGRVRGWCLRVSSCTLRCRSSRVSCRRRRAPRRRLLLPVLLPRAGRGRVCAAARAAVHVLGCL